MDILIEIFAQFVLRILEILHMSHLSTEFKEHMFEIVKNTMEYREKNHVNRKDFIQLLMELRKTGKIKGDDISSECTKTEDETSSADEFMTMEQCAAQVAIFYLAGFDTTASAIANCVYELCRNPELMQRLQNEIDEMMEKHNNVLSFENIKDLPFLDSCVLGK